MQPAQRPYSMRFTPAMLALTFAASLALPARSDGSEAPATRPTTTTTTAATPLMRRAMIWDRVQQEAQTAKELTDLERTLKAAQERAAANPDDPTTKDGVARIQRMLADTAARAAEQRNEFTYRHPAKLEKATYLGIATSPAPPVLRKQLKLGEGMGLVVDFVDPGSPADAAGVQPYDVAVRLNDQILINAPQLAVLVRTFNPGDEVTLTVIREGKEKPLRVKLVEREVKPIADTAFGPVWSDDTLWIPPARESPADMAAARKRVSANGDVVNVTVFDLEGPGLQTTVRKVIGATGTVTMPWLKEPVKVRGLNEVQVQQAIADAYRKAGVLEDANVKVDIVHPNR